MGTQDHFTYFIKPFVCRRWCGCVNPIHGLIYLQPTLSPLIPAPGCPLGPFGPSRPRSPCQTKEASSTHSLWNAKPFECIYCIACIVSSSVGFRHLFFWLVIIECNPSISYNCCLFKVSQFVWWSIALIRIKLELIQDLFILVLF